MALLSLEEIRISFNWKSDFIFVSNNNIVQIRVSHLFIAITYWCIKLWTTSVSGQPSQQQQKIWNCAVGHSPKFFSSKTGIGQPVSSFIKTSNQRLKFEECFSNNNNNNFWGLQFFYVYAYVKNDS